MGRFITPCLIKKNTPELRAKLDSIGYFVYPMNDTNMLFTDEWSAGCRGSGENARIDCGTNEELFIALAAMRQYTDKHQYFVLETTLGSVNYPDSLVPKGSLILCLTDKWDYPEPEYSSNGIPAHKASVEEIMEYFKAN